MILTKTNYRIRSSNYKWKVGTCIFAREVSEALNWEPQEVNIIILKQEELKDWNSALEKFKKAYEVYKLEKEIKKLKEDE